MLLDVIFGALFLGSIAPVVLPDETEKVRRIAKESIVLTREQMAASAKSTNHPLIKGYRTQSEARRNRARLDAGETIYFPERVTDHCGSRVKRHPSRRMVVRMGRHRPRIIKFFIISWAPPIGVLFFSKSAFSKLQPLIAS